MGGLQAALARLGHHPRLARASSTRNRIGVAPSQSVDHLYRRRGVIRSSVHANARRPSNCPCSFWGRTGRDVASHDYWIKTQYRSVDGWIRKTPIIPYGAIWYGKKSPHSAGKEKGPHCCGPFGTWRRKPESNRRTRICNPLHNHSAIAPADCKKKGSRPRCRGFPFLNTGAGDESRTRDLNLGKVALYQLSYSRVAFQHFRKTLCVQRRK